MKKNIAILPGDGVGAEVTQQSIKVLNAVAEEFGHAFIYDYAAIGADAMDKTGSFLPDRTIQICQESNAILLGAIGHSRYNNDAAEKRPEHGLLKLGKTLQLFAGIRPVTTYPSLHHLSPLKSRFLENVDFIIFHGAPGETYADSRKPGDWTENGNEDKEEYTERLIHLAFASAQKRRKKLAVVARADIEETSPLRGKVRDVAPQYRDVLVNYMFVDNAVMQVILEPKQFDVILTDSLLGEVIGAEASVLTGSPGLLPSASIGNSVALFKPVLGPLTEAAGKDIANPVGSILAAAMMLDYFDLAEEAGVVREAVEWTLMHAMVTKDIDPINFYFTTTVGDLICDYVGGRIPGSINKGNVELRKSTII